MSCFSFAGSASPSIRTSPESGDSSPPRIRSKVLFPPPDGPIKHSTRLSAFRLRESKAVWLPNRLVNEVISSFIAVTVFESVGKDGYRSGEDQVADREGNVGFQPAVGLRGVDLRLIGELLHANHAEQ